MEIRSKLDTLEVSCGIYIVSLIMTIFSPLIFDFRNIVLVMFGRK